MRKYSPSHWGKQWAANGQFMSSLLAPSSREDEKLYNLSAPERLYASTSQHCHPLSDKEDSMGPLGNHSLSTRHELRKNVISFLGEIPVTWCERWTKKTRRTRVPVYPRPLSQKWSKRGQRCFPLCHQKQEISGVLPQCGGFWGSWISGINLSPI